MFESLAHDLRAAHMTDAPQKYFAKTLLQSLGFAVLFAAALYLLLNYFKFNLPFVDSLPWWVLYGFFCGILPLAAFLLSYFTPKMKAASRKTRINLDLPYAITYMQALSTTLTLYDIFRSVYEASDLYGEVSKECGLIVRDVELFGQDMATAMENTMKITPSENFRELLNDLLLVHRSGGDMRAFFNAKSESYREIAKNEMDSLLQFLEMIAEVYVTAFVAGPIAVIIMIIAQNLSGQDAIGNLMPLLFVGLPVGAVMLISVLYVLLPANNITVTKKEVHETEFTPENVTDMGAALDKKFRRQIENRRMQNKIKNILLHPVKAYISTYVPACVIGGALVLVVLGLYLGGILRMVFPVYTLETAVCIALIAAVLPLAAAYEIRARYVARVEKNLPEMLREISDMKDIGMTLQGAIQTISGHKAGVLSTEIKIVSEEIRYGSSLSGALVRMEERIGLTTVKRAISLLVRASEVTDYIREILAIAIADLEHYLKMKNKRFNVAFVYLAIIYLSVGIYLFAAYAMNVIFISSFANFSVTFDTAGTTQQMFVIGIILSFFSGIMAGQLSANTMLSGLKHSIIMLVLTIIVFVVLI
ncbi:MAG TPA: type II secretion system F family protein [Methanocorpusculum sp.]|nr:type II secretion system F family protein [Methanocorpusculum sp.]